MDSRLMRLVTCGLRLEGMPRMRWAKLYPDLPAPLDFPPEFALREPAIRERLSIEQNAWWKQETVANCERFPFRHAHIERGERQFILAFQARQNLLRLLTKVAPLLR